MTDKNAPLCEIPTNITGTLTLDNATLDIPSGILMYVDYNTRWTTYGGTGNLILKNGEYSGAANADKYGTVHVTVENSAKWFGSVDNANIAASANATVDGIWVLDADSNVDKLVINEGATVYTNGHILSYGSITNNGTLDSSTTGLNGGVAEITASETADSAVYNLSGQMVRKTSDNLKDLKPGIYIINGSKLVIK